MDLPRVQQLYTGVLHPITYGHDEITLKAKLNEPYLALEKLYEVAWQCFVNKSMDEFRLSIDYITSQAATIVTTIVDRRWSRFLMAQCLLLLTEDPIINPVDVYPIYTKILKYCDDLEDLDTGNATQYPKSQQIREIRAATVEARAAHKKMHEEMTFESLKAEQAIRKIGAHLGIKFGQYETSGANSQQSLPASAEEQLRQGLGLTSALSGQQTCQQG